MEGVVVELPNVRGFPYLFVCLMVREDTTRWFQTLPKRDGCEVDVTSPGRASYGVCVTSRAADSLQGKIVILGHLVSLGNSHIGTVVDLRFWERGGWIYSGNYIASHTLLATRTIGL